MIAFMFFSLFISFACQPSEPLVVKSADDSMITEPSAEESDSGQPALSEFCATAPLITWDNWAGALITTHCQGCHASASPNRYGAPTSCSFDTKQQTLNWLDRIHIRVIEQETMPPAGGLLNEDLEMLEIWLECWAEKE